MENEVRLKYNYRTQRDNKYQPYATCNVTALANGLSCLGIEVNEDTLFQMANSPAMVEWTKKYFGKNGVQVIADYNNKLNQLWVILEKLADDTIGNTEGGTFKDNWLTLTDMTLELAKGHPILVGGLFTHGGHIVCLTGYNGIGFFVADPWGDWTTGYTNTNGKDVLYLFDNIRKVLTGKDGKFRALVLKK